MKVLVLVLAACLAAVVGGAEEGENSLARLLVAKQVRDCWNRPALLK